MMLADMDDLPSQRLPTLYVNNIDPKITEEQLFDLFSKYGAVKTTTLRKSTKYSPNKCSFAFIKCDYGFEGIL